MDAPEFNFFGRVKDFNRMYGLPTPGTPTVASRQALAERLAQFHDILLEEVKEVDDIIAKLQEPNVNPLDILTDLSDWLGDVIVYCSSEALRHGIPIEFVLHTIMDSNASKLGADGQPIIANGKVQKGPNYWKPEPKIRQLLEAFIAYGEKK